MSIAALPVNPANPPVGVRVLDEGGFAAAALRKVKPDAIAEVRRYMQDTAAKNPLLAYQNEFKDGEIAVAILAAASRYNSIPPCAASTTVSPSVGMPFDIFLGLSAVQLLKTSYMGRLRNEAPVSDGGVAVDLFKSDKFMMALEKFNAMHTEEARRFKLFVNANGWNSTVFSVYMFLTSFGY